MTLDQAVKAAAQVAGSRAGSALGKLMQAEVESRESRCQEDRDGLCGCGWLYPKPKAIQRVVYPPDPLSCGRRFH